MGYHIFSFTVILGVGPLLLLLYSLLIELFSPKSKIPGPWYAKWTGLVLLRHWIYGSRAFYIHSLHQQYGPVVRIGPNEIAILDLEDVKVVYTVREVFRKSPFYAAISTAESINVFNSTVVEDHRRHRRLLGGAMAETSLQSFIPQIQAKINLVIEKMKDEMKTRGATDIYKWWIFTATDVIGELSFGDSFKTLEAGKKTSYTTDLEGAAVLGAMRSSFPFMIKISHIVPIPALKKASEATMRLRGYAKISIDRYKRLLETDPARVRKTLFTKLMQAEDDEKFTNIEVRDNAQVYILAGSDTTANTLTYLIWEVCRNPEIRAKLVAEVQALPDDFSEPEVRHLPFLGHVIEETLRKHCPAASSLPRVVPPGGVALGGYWLEEGTVVSTQAYSMHRNPEIFPNPEKFDPSRWEMPTKEMKDSLMPFGRGSRICIGLHLAYIELKLATATFFRTFPNTEASKLEGMCAEDMIPRIHFLLNPQGKRCLMELK